jgi:D-3-phosphoglycerate dehydrogenase / 2-oxoglutarate reductase
MILVMKICLLENIHQVAKETFNTVDFSAEIHPKSYVEDELIELLQNFDGVGIRSKTQMTERVVEACPHLQVIGCFCIGTNQVNLDAATKAGIAVFNAPYSNTRSVAELVLSEIVALSRKLCDRSNEVHQGVWKKSATGSHEVRGKTLGIVGYGHIGSQVSILAEAFGLNVQYYDIVKKLPLGNCNSVDTLNELLDTSDFVTLHVPETPETKNMIRSEQLSQMKKGSYLLNLSRGTVVEIPALAEALKSGHLAGAAVDVYPKEPKSNQEKHASELQGLENVILTPHVGGSTEEAQFNIGQEVAASLISYLQTGQTIGSVQFPQIQAPKKENSHRLVNIHKNVPGVLSEINSIVSELGLNIQGQHLGTNEHIGYLMMDIEKDHKDVADRIKSLETSIKTRWAY